MKRDGMSFAARLSVWFALVMIGLAVALFLAAYFLLYRAVQQQDQEILETQLRDYRAWYAEGGRAALEARFNRPDSDRQQFLVRLIYPEQPAFVINRPSGAGKLQPPSFERVMVNKVIQWQTASTSGDPREWLFATTQLPDGTKLQVGKTTEAMAALLTQFRAIFGWVALIALLLGLGGGLWLTQRALAPIRQLIGAVQNVIATGRMNERMAVPKTGDEISHLARLFNTMLEKNDALIRGMREALDNVAHDLRTPLTRLRGTAELALEGEPSAEKSRDALLDTMEESDRVLTMLNTLMDISEAETGLMKLDRQPFPLAGLVAGVVELFEFVAEEKHIVVTTTIAPDVLCTADRNRLQQVLVNLLDNALKYTPDGGRVTISAAALPQETTITVQDTGAGIPAEDIPRIWERLYRGDKSRSQRGLGLGLSLVRAIVAAHGGRIDLQSTVGAGSTFTIHLPTRQT